MQAEFDRPGRLIASDAAGDAPDRPYVGILFECCGVYARVYRDPKAREYRGRCPRCLRTVRLRVGAEGTSQRLFRAQ